MDFNEILKNLKGELFKVAGEHYGELTKESKADIINFLNVSKEKIERWTGLLANGELSKNDYEWLVKGQKDLIELKGLQQQGISKISLGHFKNKIVSTIVNVVVGIIF